MHTRQNLKGIKDRLKNLLPIMSPSHPVPRRQPPLPAFQKCSLHMYFLLYKWKHLQAHCSAPFLVCCSATAWEGFPGTPAPSFTYAVPWTSIWDVSSLWLLQVGLQHMKLGVISLPRWLEGDFPGAALRGEGGVPLEWGEETLSHPPPIS